MPILVLSGPEKAGKSTLLNRVKILWQMSGKTIGRERQWHARDRDPKDLRDTRNMWALLEDTMLAQDPDILVLWDRSWVCEAIYGTLLNRPSDLADNHFLGEWLYGRAIQALGTSAILVPEQVNPALRSPDDLEVHPELEKAAYITYAKEFNLLLLENDYTEESLILNAHLLLDLLQEPILRPIPPNYGGPKDAKVVVVMDDTITNIPKGEFLPFSGSNGFKFAENIGHELALTLGWATARKFRPAEIRHTETLIAIGDDATRWCKFYVGHPNVLSTGVGIAIDASRQRNSGLVYSAIFAGVEQ